MSLYCSTFPKLQSESTVHKVRGQIVITIITDSGQINIKILICNISGNYTYYMLI